MQTTMTTETTTFRIDLRDCLEVQEITRDMFRRELETGTGEWTSTDVLEVEQTDEGIEMILGLEEILQERGLSFEIDNEIQ